MIANVKFKALIFLFETCLIKFEISFSLTNCLAIYSLEQKISKNCKQLSVRLSSLLFAKSVYVYWISNQLSFSSHISDIGLFNILFTAEYMLIFYSTYLSEFFRTILDNILINLNTSI